VINVSQLETVSRKVQASFSSFCDRQNHIEIVKSEHTNELMKILAALESEHEQTLKELSDIEARLNGFINIASAHATNLIDIGYELEYDSGTLSRLAVQINNSSTSDKYAEELYTCATAQLRGIRRRKTEANNHIVSKKQNVERSFKIDQISINKDEMNLNAQIEAYLISEEFQEFIELLLTDNNTYNTCCSDAVDQSFVGNDISLGVCRIHIPVPKGFEQQVSKASKGLYSIPSFTFPIPFTVDVNYGTGLLIEYHHKYEESMLKGIQNFIVNIIKRYKTNLPQITYVDPIRFNNSTLGALMPLSLGKNSVIENVPLTIDEVKKKIISILNEIIATEKIKHQDENVLFARRIVVLHGYPYAYDSSLLSQIQQLFVNATHYNVIVIATHSVSAKSGYSFDGSLIKSIARLISCNSSGFIADYNGQQVQFEWYSSPLSLSSSFLNDLVVSRTKLEIDNDYIQRVGLVVPNLKKGNRELRNIPYGIDSEGKILTLDFEDSNFATFICGAARSGKSTLLHTILSHIIKNYHPDDVEIWLVDFKMTEFSRYINHLPPHIRYIVLDESPELVYDLIDRLTEVLEKRQSIFMERWLKLADVPKEKYMPSIFVVIDEFSIMSQIVADSVISASEDYTIKLQKLLAKGAALGFHFIFASQGFTDGSRGLTAFSKKQIQLRLAMKTDYVEIKETLDLKSTSDTDRSMMEQLEPHHVLVRMHVDESGNHLKLAKTLYISDYSQQENMIDLINKRFSPVSRYVVSDTMGYISKRPVIINGNKYKSFISQQEEMKQFIDSNSTVDDHADFLFIGDPKRLMPLYPIEVFDGFSENFLVISPLHESDPGLSILLSIAMSVNMCNRSISIWTNRRNNLFRRLPTSQIPNINKISKEVDEVCAAIKYYKSLIENKVQGNEFIFVLGAESLIMDMSFLESSFSHTSNDTYSPLASMDVDMRKPDEPDILSLLEMVESGSVSLDEVEDDKAQDVAVSSAQSEEVTLYDARDDLNYILTHGSRLGYHFVFTFSTVGEFVQCKIPNSLFKHKITFRLSKTDAMELTGVSKSNAILNLAEHCFRYTNGLDSVSFRPYMHQSLSWDGWVMNGSEVEMSVSDEDEYLL